MTGRIKRGFSLKNEHKKQETQPEDKKKKKRKKKCYLGRRSQQGACMPE